MLVAVGGLVLTSKMAVPALAQTQGCEPIAARAGREFGCFVTAREELGKLPKEPALYWHLDNYANRLAADRAAAESAKGPRGTVVESIGRIWLFTIAPAGWRPKSGERVAEIGPLPLVDAEQYAAVYMEGIFKPGMDSEIHRHAGAEAWYTLTGEMCLETPEGTLVQRAGDPGVIVRAGPPMRLSGIGTGIRRSLVLILQDASQPRSTVAHDWTPKGLCKGRR